MEPRISFHLSELADFKINTIEEDVKKRMNESGYLEMVIDKMNDQREKMNKGDALLSRIGMLSTQIAKEEYYFNIKKEMIEKVNGTGTVCILEEYPKVPFILTAGHNCMINRKVVSRNFYYAKLDDTNYQECKLLFFYLFDENFGLQTGSDIAIFFDNNVLRSYCENPAILTTYNNADINESNVFIAGYPYDKKYLPHQASDKDKRKLDLSKARNGIHSNEFKCVDHLIDTEKGQSGAGLCYFDRKNQVRVIGVHNGNDSQKNVAALITDYVYETIKTIIENKIKFNRIKSLMFFQGTIYSFTHDIKTETKLEVYLYKSICNLICLNNLLQSKKSITRRNIKDILKNVAWEDIQKFDSFSNLISDLNFENERVIDKLDLEEIFILIIPVVAFLQSCLEESFVEIINFITKESFKINNKIEIEIVQVFCLGVYYYFQQGKSNPKEACFNIHKINFLKSNDKLIEIKKKIEDKSYNVLKNEKNYENMLIALFKMFDNDMQKELVEASLNSKEYNLITILVYGVLAGNKFQKDYYDCENETLSQLTLRACEKLIQPAKKDRLNSISAEQICQAFEIFLKNLLFEIN